MTQKKNTETARWPGYVLTADNLGLCTKSRQEKHLSVRSLVRSFRKIVNEFWKVTIPEIQPVLQT